MGSAIRNYAKKTFHLDTKLKYRPRQKHFCAAQKFTRKKDVQVARQNIAKKGKLEYIFSAKLWPLPATFELGNGCNKRQQLLGV